MNTYAMTTSTLWKRADNGLLAHIYEHLAATSIDTYMMKMGYYFVADYDLFAHTYGSTCFLEATFYTHDAENTYKQAVIEFQKLALPTKLIVNAVQQCAIEHQRQVETYTGELEPVLAKLHEAAWQDIHELTVDQATPSTSVNTLFTTDELSYIPMDQGGFTEYYLEYIIPEEHTKSASQKALAVVVMQIFALNFYRFLSIKYTFYDTGDEWANGAASVNYRTKIRVKSSASLQPSVLMHEFNTFRSQYVEQIVRATVRLLRENYSKDHSAVYFGQSTLNNILGGVVIGGMGWLEVASNSITNSLAGAIELDVYEGSS